MQDQYRATRLANGLIRVRDYASGLESCFQPTILRNGFLTVQHAFGDLYQDRQAFQTAHTYARAARITLSASR